MKDPSVPLLIDFRTFQVFHLGFFLLFEMKISGWLGRALDNTRCQSRVGDKAVNNFAVRTSGWHAVAARNGRAHSSSHVPSESDASLSCIKSATPLRLHTTQGPAASGKASLPPAPGDEPRGGSPLCKLATLAS
jgi:hypothetical protein